MTEYILETKDLIFKYTNDRVLNEISVKIEKGKKTVFLGENGAGKSTLFLHFNGILKPNKGKVFFKGEEVKYDQTSLMKLRKSVGIVFQDPDTQLFSASVTQEVSFGPMNLGFPKEKVEEYVEYALGATGTSFLRDKPTHFLSYGQKKRVTIASIIAMEPEVIIFDEPTNYLDPKHKIQIMDFLTELNKNGTTIILSTHDVDRAYSWADNIFVMKNGNILKEGSPEEIFADSKVLNSTNLTSPMILDIYEELKSKGYIDLQKPFPRNKTELFECIADNAYAVRSKL
ncbi:MAG: energy-coupling factor ABC transporter ATP-binding protein [Candidatus Melainabacteria bacterium RIFOXYA12_FULL_32_12]|nr:MAG: energy-coupling factor ABC transporter ATP-binding protein [Candidatus Melainabacteria bacterium RIFOXYA12_FULL_32_12]